MISFFTGDARSNTAYELFTSFEMFKEVFINPDDMPYIIIHSATADESIKKFPVLLTVPKYKLHKVAEFNYATVPADGRVIFICGIERYLYPDTVKDALSRWNLEGRTIVVSGERKDEAGIPQEGIVPYLLFHADVIQVCHEEEQE